MLKYIVKRILIFIPTLIAVSLITFLLSSNAPGDPVDSMLNKNQGGEGQATQKIATEKAYNNLRHELGFDLPLFYFSFSNATACDTLYKIPQADHRSNLERLSFTFGNWSDVAAYYNNVRNFENELYFFRKSDSTAASITKCKDYVNSLYTVYDEIKITTILSNLDFTFDSNKKLADLGGAFNALKNSFHFMLHNKNSLNRYKPVLIFYGTNNQYHNWITKFLRFDFGISYQDKRPVGSVLWSAIGKTMKISLLSILIAYLIAIPIGIKSAINKGKTSERTSTTFLFILYSLPNFWIGTLLVIFLCGGDYLSWFPAPGVPPIPDDAPWWYSFAEGTYRLILPLFCWTYASFAFISRQMRGGMLNTIGQDYIRTARAKGLDEKTVIWKHAFRNSLIPIITLFSHIFPLAISGSFVIEFIFSIPGMGKEILDALNARDYPIVFTIIMFTAILTMIGNLIADILYAIVDPRISFTTKR